MKLVGNCHCVTGEAGASPGSPNREVWREIWSVGGGVEWCVFSD